MNNAKLTEKSFCTINFLALSEEQYTFLLSFYKAKDKRSLKKYLRNGYKEIKISTHYSDLLVDYPDGTDFEEIRPLLVAAKQQKMEAKKLADEKTKVKLKKWIKANRSKYPSFVMPLMAREAGFSFELLSKQVLNQKGQMLLEWHNKSLLNRITRMAFNNADFGRLRKKYEGNNSMYPSIRTESEGSGWDCVRWHYADFTAIINPPKTKVWVKYADGTEENITLWRNFTKINGKFLKLKTETKTTKISQVAKLEILTHFNRGGVLNVVMNGVDWCYQDQETKELYHFDNEISNWRTRNPFTIAVTAFKKRRIAARDQAKQKAFESLCFSNLDKIFVSVEDSLQSGNCQSNTLSTRIDVMKELGLDPETIIAVRADVLMDVRNDNYSKRAVWYSFTNHYKEKSLAW